MSGDLYNLKQGNASPLDLRGAQGLMSMGVGNVYRVIKSTETYYQDFLTDYDGYYTDGSAIVHTTIQSALDATVECRNDYVIVQPSDSDYDITAALTMSKKCVHLICPAGLGNDIGATNACRIHQTTAATNIIQISDASIEVAGFYLKPYTNVSHITLAATSYSPNIHHNSFMLFTSSTTCEPAIAGTGDAGAWGSIERNWFVAQSGNDATIAKIVSIQPSATAARVCFNEFTIGDGLTATIALYNGATKGMVRGNIFGGAGADCTYTHCIGIGSYGNAFDNKGVVADGEIITGGETNASAVHNWNAGTNGGLVDDAQ